MQWDHTVDFLIVGSGAASVPAALAAKGRGKSVLVIEKLADIGGSTAYSGGVAWFPNTKYVAAAGNQDSAEHARLYLDTLVPPSPSSSPAKRDAFCRDSPEVVEFLERHGMKWVDCHWPDYYSDVPGGTRGGRSLVAPTFVVSELGEWAKNFSGHPVYKHVPVGAAEGCLELGLAKRTWKGRKAALRVAGRMLRQKITGKELGVSGRSMQGRLLQIGLREQVPFWNNTPCEALVIENGRVTGIVASRDGKSIRIAAREGVLLNSGGFARSAEMRAKYHKQPSRPELSQSPPGDQGDMIQQAMDQGAAVDNMDALIFVAGSYKANTDWELYGMHQPAEVGKPHAIVVDAAGRRFHNETCSYMEFGRAMYESNAIPAWAVLESRHRNRYNWGWAMPGQTPEEWFTSGYAQRADTVEELARKCGMNPTVFKATVERFNAFAATGVDTDFGRGSSFYNKAWGDPSSDTPNPTIGALEKPPYYAIKLWPNDVGTAGGLVTDEHARVLRADGTAIDGLYATGNTTASLFGGVYPGAGASISASMLFGYRAAKHACG